MILHGSCLGLERAVLDHLLGDYNGVQRGTPQQLIAHDEEFKRVIEGDVLTKSTHLDVVLSGGSQRHGIFEISDIVHELHAGRILQRLTREGDIDGLVEYGDDALRVRARRGDAYRRATANSPFSS